MPAVCNGREVVDSTTSSLWKRSPSKDRRPSHHRPSLNRAVYDGAPPAPSNMLQRDNSVWVDWLTVARVTLTVKAKWCSHGEQCVSIVKPFCIDLICRDLLGLQIDVIKCTVPCPKESCCQMGACEAIVSYKTKGCSYLVLTVLWIYSNVVVNDKKKMLWNEFSPSVEQNMWLTIVNVMKSRQLDNIKDMC